MSRIITVGKPFSYESSSLKTPTFKEISPAPCSYDSTKDETPHPPILMDEFGQTPDHYYLARKPPPSFFQVKRKLDLHSVGSSKGESKRPAKTRQKNKATVSEKPKGRAAVEKQRYDTSLGQLTKKFLKLLSDATDGILNLNTACSLLAVPKRRLYDITNVLEGAGLIQKKSRNNIQWMGRVSSPCANAVKYELEREIDILEAKENKLDELIYYMKSQMNTVLDEEANYRYVTCEDLKNIEEFSQKTVISVNTTPSSEIVESNEKTLVIKSKCTEIEAYLLCNDVSLANLIHPKALFKENSYQIKIDNNILEDNGPDTSNETLYLNEHDILIRNPMEVYNPMCSGAVWSHGDTVIKNAFITEEDDIAPMGKNFLLQTEDQDLDLPLFSLLETPMDNYSFSLDDGEGITDLFDCGFSCP
ncbi:Transcription factor E2F1 like protein [Argiope bruennichi]|uniref:Transcription factor E2F1 like protein n=1 Tax=Argiope bruennichi TaxID=94029 RepID=A0A8T0FLG3_ARGBR|nr:Transcription factor E2F1 like protein [Argiope bruennichi]